MDSSKHGLTAQQINIIAAILRPYVDRITSVGLFGSRASGTFKPHSDIDLVIKGTLTQADIDRLHTLFEESLLPYKVDVNAYDLIAYPPLKRHVDTAFSLLFTQDDLREGGR